MTTTILDPGHNDADYLRDLGWTEEDIDRAIGNAGPSPEPAADEWPEPTPLNAPYRPPFPIHTLGKLRPMVEAVAESYQTPADLPALVALTGVAAAVGGKRTFVPRDDWKEISALWGLPVLPSGELKSPAMDRMLLPIFTVERELKGAACPLREQYDQQLRIAEARLAEAEKAAGRAKPGEADKAAAAADGALLNLRELGTPPVVPRLTAMDVTPEKLGQLMSEQEGRAAIFASEAGWFSTIAGRYSGVPNLDLILGGYSGSRAKVDRTVRVSIDMESTCLTLCLCAQPGILEGLAADRKNAFRDSGLLARFLYSVPVSLVGNRKMDPEPVDKEIAQNYDRMISNLVRTVWSSSGQIELRPSTEAYKLFQEFRAELEPKLGEDGQLAEVADWGKKLAGQLFRIAGLLTLVDDPMSVEITAERMRDALGMAEYFTAHALYAIDLMTSNRANRHTPARDVLAWIRRTARPKDTPFTFNRSDAWNGCNGRKWAESIEDVQAALDELEGFNWIAKQESPTTSTPPGRGRPKLPRYDVHPKILEAH